MRWKLLVLPVLALIFMTVAFSAHAQVIYSAEEGKQPFTVGVGISDFSDDWGITNPRQLGITVTGDWRPPLPGRLRGLGIEAEGRDINWHTPSGIPGHRMDTLLGGPFYQWRRPGRIRPYVKYLMGIGSIDFPGGGATYTHDTRAVFVPGGGVDFRVWNRVSVRGDYEYQYWHQLFGRHDLTPNGFTIGAVYDFGLRKTQ
jgi:opacity protein-like surface antigen